MKVVELRNFSVEELIEKENDFKSEMFNLKIQMATGKIETPSRMRFLRRSIARVKTILNEKKAENKVEQN